MYVYPYDRGFGYHRRLRRPDVCCRDDDDAGGGNDGINNILPVSSDVTAAFRSPHGIRACEGGLGRQRQDVLANGEYGHS